MKTFCARPPATKNKLINPRFTKINKFIIYVSFGGMLAVTWTDMFQGALMIVIIIGTAFYLTINNDLNNLPLIEATNQSPGLGSLEQQSLTSYIGAFVIWAAAISVVPHIVMRVYSSKDSYSAKLSLNVAILLYSVMILSSLFVIVPMGKILSLILMMLTWCF